MFKAKAITAVIVTGIFGLAACGGGSGDKDDSTVTTVRQKNAALSFTTLPATTVPKTATTPVPLNPRGSGVSRPTTTAPMTVTTPVPALGGNTVPATTTTQNSPTTIVPKTATTPVPRLPTRPK